jgi:hypothetical protein
MLNRTHRLCTVAFGAAIAIFAIVAPAVAVSASTTSACTATTGVTVIVDFSHFGGKIERGCAPGHPADTLTALHAAGFATAGTVQYGDGFVCRIDGLPTPQHDACTATPPSTAYWAFWHARPTDTAWTYTDVGVLDYRPAPGSIAAFAFGAHALPGLTPAAALPPTPTTTSTATTTPPTAPPSSQAPLVTAATVTTAGTTASTAPATRGVTSTTAHAKSRPHVTATTGARGHTRPSTTVSGLHIVERSASGPLPHDNGGSPLPALLTVAVVGALAIGGALFARTRRRATQ